MVYLLAAANNIHPIRPQRNEKAKEIVIMFGQTEFKASDSSLK